MLEQGTATHAGRGGRVAVVTAASSGIGLGAARALAARGWSLVLMSRSEKIETVAAELGALWLRGDVTSEDDMARLVAMALDRHGRIDGAVINTGHPPKGDILQIADEDWHKAIEIVLMPTVRALRHLAPVFARQKSGAAVSVSSYTAREPELTYPLSAVFRAALASFLKLCVARHGGEGWRINAVLPGFVDNYSTTPEALAKIPMGRYAAVKDELGATIAFLLSEEAGYITGQGLLVDGGLVRAI
ncbi:3-oxoacyl-ACP reductase [Pannonibacter phragmitetus]|uniref:SDR family oxidoreductase n=1 Tax=Pannonibacter phragmitetus TaxID=121719 RepID=UPI00067E08E9|nr:SDR family oxidoreductase [Pannonibacter phragmitetus]KND16145.1 3-oxoacyl-ACP reductase [Pannonibacter phragmitetus]